MKNALIAAVATIFRSPEVATVNNIFVEEADRKMQLLRAPQTTEVSGTIKGLKMGGWADFFYIVLETKEDNPRLMSFIMRQYVCRIATPGWAFVRLAREGDQCTINYCANDLEGEAEDRVVSFRLLRPLTRC